MSKNFSKTKDKTEKENFRSRNIFEACVLGDALRAMLPGTGHNSLKGLLQRGQVLVDDVPAKRLDHALAPGQVVKLLPRGERPAKAPLPILYEDAHLIAVNKPAGLLTVPTEHNERRTALELVDEYLKKKDSRLGAFLVHRLDRDTSGVLLFAKSRPVQSDLRARWEELTLLRGYQAVVEGAPRQAEGVVDKALNDRGMGRVKVRADGRPARTRYRVLERGREYALLELALETGRKNQIRSHLSYLGCPVAGDDKYGALNDPMGRLCLHAHALTLTHPVTGEELAIRCPAPANFLRTVRGESERPGR